jgi:hypothetical protein
MIERPWITQTAAQLTAVIRLTIPREEIRNVMGPGISELMAAVAAQGIAPAGPWFTHHLRMDPDTFSTGRAPTSGNATPWARSRTRTRPPGARSSTDH